MKRCGCCGKELTPKTVLGGFMGLMTRLFNRRTWENFANCQKCRDLYIAGYSVEEIRDIRWGIKA